MGMPPPTSNPTVLSGNMMGMELSPATSTHDLALASTSNHSGIDSSMTDMTSPMPRPTHPNLAMDGNLSEMNPHMSRQAQDAGYDVSSSFLNQPSFHTWELPLRFIPPTGPVDSILIDLLQRQRNIALEGATGTNLTGPVHPNVRGLLGLEESGSTHPVASVLVDLVNRTALKSLAEKAAAMYVVYRLIQWQISPGPESYNNLPEWFGPRASQLATSHPIWSTTVS